MRAQPQAAPRIQAKAAGNERPPRYRVMRRLPITSTEFAEVGTIIEQEATWPFRRAKQFVDSGYLAPIVTEEG